MTTSNQVARLQFFIPREPKPAPRVRCARRGNFVSAYNPSDYTEWKQQAAAEIKTAIPAVTLAGVDLTKPVTVAAEFVCTPPRTTKLDTPKPDLDNYVKALLDAGTQSGVLWGDDKQVVGFNRVRKRWATPGEPPGTYVTIEYDITPARQRQLVEEVRAMGGLTRQEMLGDE